ncbi:MAG: hypothetical protein H5U19_14300 [Rhodobacteraceae bacterium]|nr:hypothetical protein [Paracoccaceae bacterium]
MKTVNPIQTETTFFLPARAALAVGHAITSDKTRYYLGGVYIESETTGLTAIATDGHLMLWAPLPEGAHVGEKVSTQSDDVSRGFILAMDHGDKALRAKGDLWIYGDAESGIAQVLTRPQDDSPLWPRVGVLEFSRVDGSFPNWRRVRPQASPGDSACAPSVDLRHVARLHAAAKVYIGNGVCPALFSTSAPGDPVRVGFSPTCEGLQGVIVPVRM